MKWFWNMRIKGKIWLGFTVMNVIMLVIGATGYRSASSINNRLDEIFEVRFPSLNYLVQADRDLQQLLVAERSMIFTDPGSDLFKNLYSDYEENLAQSAERFGKFKKLITTSQEETIVGQYEKARLEWSETSSQGDQKSPGGHRGGTSPGP